MSASTTLIERCRPQTFDDIILSPLNKAILSNILLTGHFCNLLLVGPPGTGKTTTAINLIRAYQERHEHVSKRQIMHVNASDDRGIAAIRDRIHRFIASGNMFEQGRKYVILDEVDSLTKSAQQALSELLQSYTGTARFCLICNFNWCLSRALQSHFVKLHFCQLPHQAVQSLLQRISRAERLGYTAPSIDYVQRRFSSDVRSMINFMHSHAHPQNKSKLVHIVNDRDLEDLLRSMRQLPLGRAYSYLQTISQTFNVEPRAHLLHLLRYVVAMHPEMIASGKLLREVKLALHTPHIPTATYVEHVAAALQAC
jgi:DNA polymerase III delta prime subunit